MFRKCMRVVRRWTIRWHLEQDKNLGRHMFKRNEYFKKLISSILSLERSKTSSEIFFYKKKIEKREKLTDTIYVHT